MHSWTHKKFFRNKVVLHRRNFLSNNIPWSETVVMLSIHSYQENFNILIKITGIFWILKIVEQMTSRNSVIAISFRIYFNQGSFIIKHVKSLEASVFHTKVVISSVSPKFKELCQATFKVDSITIIYKFYFFKGTRPLFRSVGTGYTVFSLSKEESNDENYKF